MSNRAVASDQNDCPLVDSATQVRGLARPTWDHENTMQSLKKLGATLEIAQLILPHWAVEFIYERVHFFTIAPIEVCSGVRCSYVTSTFPTQPM